MNIYYLIVVTIFFSTCKSPEQYHPTLLQLSDNQKITFLDSTQAASAIISDTLEHFFDHISALDMAIQMKTMLDTSKNRKAVLYDYKNALQKEVLSFTSDEVKFITSIFQNIFSECNSLSKNIFPSEIKLIKIKGSHYGETTYYTRENCIVIPQAELTEPDSQKFTKVMLHELFHVFSRLNHQKKLELYKLIGFKSTGGSQFLQIDENTKKKIILNPDGIDYSYSIQLKDRDENTFNAIPLIISNEGNFDENKPRFFDYIHFGLYKIMPPFSKLIKVVSDENGESTINFKDHPEFFEQITDNTKYIIHPDELMADNFVIAIQSRANNEILNDLSASGQELIEEVIAVISD